MTILTKPNGFNQIKKDTAKCPLSDEIIIVEEESDKVETYTRKPLSCCCRGLMALLVVAVAVVGIYSGLYLIHHCQLRPLRYQRFCSIPIDTKQLQESAMMEQNYRMLPLRWSSTMDPDLQVFADDPSPDDVVNFLREELDIGDQIEKITVFENGRQTSFIHDFDANYTTIVDSDRCFTMELDASLVLTPQAFILSIHQGDAFDVTPVRSTLRALLPARAPRSPRSPPRRLLADLCHAKPVYNLERTDSPIRKRSVEEPAHYIQFSGRHIHEIEIENLADLVKEEKPNN